MNSITPINMEISSFPKIEGSEPLRTELNHFLDCIENDETPLSDGNNGLEVVRILRPLRNRLIAGASIF